MRIWSIHPQYLDSKGLVALWRETLLAKNVLEDKTKGYKNHPQLTRFKNLERPVDGINQYLLEVYDEATRRGYHFNKEKINLNFKPSTITVTDKQLEYEFNHLLKKLKIRDTNQFNKVAEERNIQSAIMFDIIEGEIEDWEIIY